MRNATIGFFGDSFCAGREPESWCVLLAERLKAKVVHWGEPGRSIWSTFFNFNQFALKNNPPSFIIFCYTEPFRLYHPKIILSANTQPLPGVDPNIYKALDQYWLHLHSYDKDMLAYEYALKWFDHDVISKIRGRTILQTWSFRPFETMSKDANIKLNTGIFVDESMFELSVQHDPDLYKKGITVPHAPGIYNHMTMEQNKLWADKLYNEIKDYHERHNRPRIS